MDDKVRAARIERGAKAIWTQRGVLDDRWFHADSWENEADDLRTVYIEWATAVLDAADSVDDAGLT